MASEAFHKWRMRLRQTGDICPLRLGMTREQVRSILGDPDDTGGTSRKHRTPAIWKYEEIEFHFGPKRNDMLSLIYTDTENTQGIASLIIGSNE